MDDSRELTFGEKAVGLTFNPSNDANVQAVKEGYARTIDVLHDLHVKAIEIEHEGGGMAPHATDLLPSHFYQEAIWKAIDAQMAAVKAITWK